MSLVIDGKKIEVPGLVTKSWLDLGGPPKNVKCNRNDDRRISGIILHTVRGIAPGTISKNPDGSVAVATNDSSGRAYARYWSNPTAKAASAALIVCEDGSVLCINDLRDEVSWHACGANGFTLGIEIYQRPDGTVFKATYDACVKLVHFLTAEFGIQRQVPATLVNGVRKPSRGLIARLNQDKGGPAGRDFYGIWGHRNNTAERGPGDPGDVIFQMLLDAGYEGFDVAANEDKTVWSARQKALGIPAIQADGVPGKNTKTLLEAKGYAHGVWVKIP